MAKRGGPSLSVKMILTTTLLVIVTVVGSAVLNVMNVRRVIDDATDDKILKFRAALAGNGEFGAPLFARAVEPSLIDKGNDVPIHDLAKITVASDTKDVKGVKDYGLRLALVLDQKADVVAHCFEAETTKCNEVKPGLREHDKLGPAFGQLTVDSWKQAWAGWETAAKSKGSALVEFDTTADGASYQIFAFPVINGAPATPEAALAQDAGPRQGYVMLGYDLAPISAYAATAADEKRAVSTRAALYSAVVGALFVLIGTVLAILQGLSITRPIKQLAYRADQIARGDLESRVEVTSSDEIGLLGENFNFMADQIAILLEQTAEKARIEQELEVARAIQESLVPTADPVDRKVLKFAGFYQPAAQTGGDWWTWHELVGNKILLVIGDVTGHGVPSAMITAAAKAACDVARHVHGDDVTVTRLLEIMNHAIFESAQRRFVMTCFASIVDTKTRTITYANAGHNFPYLFRVADGKGEFGSLMIRGNRLGDDPASRYDAKTTELLAGDVIVWYTDGIVECENEKGEEYGEKRFRASVRRAAALDAGEMRDAIVADATNYFAETPRKDDITMIVGRIH
jgi:serine phosphatase RsbU (regulator of sigma subunit)